MTRGSALRLETPEGIDLEIQPAGPVARGLALAIDATITSVVTTVSAISLSMLGEAGIGLYLVLYFVVEWFYPVLFEVLSKGQTPGKRALGLRVVSEDATPIGWNDSFVRNLLRVVDFLPFFYLTGLVSLMLTDRFQRLGDLAGGTLVVHADEGSDGLRRIGEPGAATAGLGAARLPVPLPIEEQRAIVGWSERQSLLSEDRSIELSDQLAALSGSSGEEGRRALLRIANGIVGGE